MQENKIIVIGPPGSGKTYLSNILGKCFNLLVIHLDEIYYQNDKPIKAKAFDLIIDELLKQDKWIIDGHYFFNLHKRIEKCDSIYFLDLSREEVYQSLINRNDDAWYKERGIKDFDNWFNNYETNIRNEIYHLINNCNKKVTTFHSREEVNEYIKTLL